MASFKVTPASDTPLLFGESPLWDGRKNGLVFVDQVDRSVGLLDPLNRTITKKIVGVPPGTNTIQVAMPYSQSNSKFLVGTSSGQLLEWDWDHHYNEQAKVLDTLPSTPSTPFYCDAKCDSKGRFWGGTFVKDVDGNIVPTAGGLYKFEKSAKKSLNYEINSMSATFKYDLPNGLGWNKENNKFYLVDFLPKKIYVMDYNEEEGTLGNRKTVFDFNDHKDVSIFDQGHPDGLVHDLDGNLWVACVKGGALIKIDSTTGQLLNQVKIPASMTTSMCFGGPVQSTMFVTTCSVDYDANNTPISGEPHAGKIFSVTCPQDNSFKGFDHYFFG